MGAIKSRVFRTNVVTENVHHVTSPYGRFNNNVIANYPCFGGYYGGLGQNFSAPVFPMNCQVPCQYQQSPPQQNCYDNCCGSNYFNGMNVVSGAFQVPQHDQCHQSFDQSFFGPAHFGSFGCAPAPAPFIPCAQEYNMLSQQFNPLFNQMQPEFFGSQPFKLPENTFINSNRTFNTMNQSRTQTLNPSNTFNFGSNDNFSALSITEYGC